MDGSISALHTHVLGSESAKAKVQKFATLAIAYHRQARRLESFRSRFHALHDDDLVSIRQLFTLYGIYDRARMQLSLTGPIRAEITSFLLDVYDTVEHTMVPSISSHKCSRNGVVAHVVIRDCATILMNACERLVLCNTNAVVGDVTPQTVAALDDVWRRVCATTIEHERVALESELEQVQKLAAVVLQCIQMASNRRESASILSVATCSFATVAHMYRRITKDPWFTAYHASSTGMRYLSMRENGLESRFVEWVRASAQSFYDALVVDCGRVERVLKEALDSNAWHRLDIVAHSIECTESSSVRLMPPSYLRKFDTPTGNVYITNEPRSPGDVHGASVVRELTCVRALWVIRAMVARKWLPLDVFCKKYVDGLVDAEVRLYSDRTVDMIEHVAATCNESGCTISEADIYTLLARETCTPTDDKPLRNSNSSSTTPCTVMPMDDDGGCRYRPSPHPRSTTTTVPPVQSASVDNLVPPQAIDPKAFDARVDCVHVFSLFEYGVICALTRMLWAVINRSRWSGTSEDLLFTNSEVLSDTVAILQHDYDILPERVKRTLSSRASAVQHTSLAIRKVLTAGKGGFDAAERCKATGRLAWDAEYGTDAHDALRLRIGRGSRDPMGLTYIELCLRLKAHLDEDWPLPEGVSWPVTRPRRGAR
jgi:hypothetical protein